MAGSYNHVVNKKSGKLRKPQKVLAMLETRSGDVYEAVEEMYGMIWYLADYIAEAEGGGRDPAHIVEQARLCFKQGLEVSPGAPK